MTTLACVIHSAIYLRNCAIGRDDRIFGLTRLAGANHDGRGKDVRLATLAVTPNSARLSHETDFAVVGDDYEGDGPIEACIAVAPPVSFGVQNMLCQTVIGSPPTIVTFRPELRSNGPARQITLDVLAGDGEVSVELRDTLAIDWGDDPFRAAEISK
jgi:hypothetical protein